MTSSLKEMKTLNFGGPDTYQIIDDTALHSSDITSTYSATGTAAVNGTAVASAISGKQDSSTAVTYNGSATGGVNQGVYIDANGLVQLCDAVTSIYLATGTAPVNGTAIASAIANLVHDSRTINNKDLSSNIILDASDVGALPSTTTINSLTNEAQQNALNSGANSTNIGQIATNTSDISTINDKIPSAATTQNQLADKAFVNSTVATNTANFIGTFSNIPSLNAYSGTVTNNDYAFVVNSVITDSGNDWASYSALNAYTKSLLTNFDYAWVINGTKFDLYRFDIIEQTWDLKVSDTIKETVTLNTAYNRYKATVSDSTTTWAYEFTLNNSSFTADQWAAITSGITSGDVALIATALQSSDVVSTYNSSGTAPINGAGVAAALATLTIPTTTNSVTSGGTAALTSGGAYTNLVRRLSTSAATGSTSQGVYIDANGQVQTCTAVTSTYNSSGTAPVNGTAVASALSNLSFAPISSITTQDITTLNSGTIALTSGVAIYKHTPSAATTYSFSTSNLSLTSSVAYTFELLVIMTSTAYTLTFPASLTWQDGSAPDLSATGTYYFAFRTVNAGTNWIGNLQGKW